MKRLEVIYQIFYTFRSLTKKKSAYHMDTNQEAFLWIVKNQQRLHEEYIESIS